MPPFQMQCHYIVPDTRGTQSISGFPPQELKGLFIGRLEPLCAFPLQEPPLKRNGIVPDAVSVALADDELYPKISLVILDNFVHLRVLSMKRRGL